MGLLDWLLRRKPSGRRKSSLNRASESEMIRDTKAAIEAVAMGHGPAGGRFPKLRDAAPELLTQTPTSAVVIKDGPLPVVNIWDMEKVPANLPPPLILNNPLEKRPALAQPDSNRRASRTRTRVLGFEPQATAVVPLFGEGRIEAASDSSAEPATPGQARVMFPTGWLVVARGPGRGAAFALAAGASQIGRGADQTVALDFGDLAISRMAHAVVSYDAATHRFRIDHGGKSNLVRLNGRPLLATEGLADGDEIQIGETTLMLRVLCSAAFNWTQGEAEGDGNDMAIA